MVTCAETWHMFCCGVFCYLLLNRKILWPLAAFYLIGMTLLKIDGTIAPVRVGVLLAIVVAACLTNKLGVWLKARPFQYFGRISYSLYLVHGIVGVPLLFFAYRIGVKTTIPLIACYLLAIGLTIGVADLMYRFVERPTVRFSKLLKSPVTDRGLPVLWKVLLPFRMDAAKLLPTVLTSAVFLRNANDCRYRNRIRGLPAGDPARATRRWDFVA